MRIRADARCPNTYYEEMMNKDFEKWSKMQLIAFININSDEDMQVTMRPRKSTLVRIAEKIQLKEMAKKKPKTNPALLDATIEEMLAVKPKSILTKAMEFLVLAGVMLFFIIIFMEVLAFSFGIELGHFIGMLAIFLMIFGIPLTVYYWEKK